MTARSHRLAPRHALLLAIPLLAVSGCGRKTAPAPPEPKADFSGFFSGLKDCRAHYREIDARIDAAGVRYPAFYRVPGFPYLRTDRLLASYRNEVHSVDEVGGWLRHMRELDQEAREFEYENLGMSPQEVAIARSEFLTCGSGLAALELDNPEALQRLISLVQPPDENGDGFLRRIGLEGLGEPLLKSRIDQRRQQLLATFDTPLEQLLGDRPTQRWALTATGDPSLIPASIDQANADELGLPGIVESGWVAIAEANAPRLLFVHEGQGAPRLGTPVMTADGASVDVTAPKIDYQIGFTRFGGRALVQVDYFVWLHPDRGDGIDGFVWRTTLDEQVKPLVYDAVRASGLDHVWFPVQDLARRDSPEGRAAVLPQSGPAPQRPVLLLDRSGYIRRVVADSELPAGPENRYTLQRYEDLGRLATPSGGSRNLFDPDGLAGSATAVDSLALLSDIPGLGRPRHLAHLPGGLLASRAFDDPAALDEVFERQRGPQSTAAGTP